MAADGAIVTYAIFCVIVVVSLVFYLIRSFALPSIKFHIRAIVFVAWTLSFTIIALLPIDLLDNESAESALVDLWSTVYWVAFAWCWVVVPVVQDYYDNGAFRKSERVRAAVLPSLILYSIALTLAGTILIILLATGHVTTQSLPGLMMAISTTYGLVILTLTLGYGFVEFPRQVWFSGDRDRRLRFLEHTMGSLHDDALVEQDTTQQTVMFLEELQRKLDRGHPLREYVDIARGACPSQDGFDFALGASGSARVHTVEEVTALEKLKLKPVEQLTERDIAKLHHMAKSHTRVQFIMYHQWHDTATEYFNLEALRAVQQRSSTVRCLAAPLGYPSMWSAVQNPAAAVVLATVYPGSAAANGGHTVHASMTATGTRGHGHGGGSDDIDLLLDTSSGNGNGGAGAPPPPDLPPEVPAAPGGIPALTAPASSPSWADRRYHYAVHWQPIVCRIGALMLTALSLILMWSEVVFVMPIDLSPIGAIVASVNDSVFLTQLFTLVPVAYISSCSFFTIFRVRIGQKYFMHPNKRTDVVSMLHNAAFALLLAPPMARNFFKMLRIDNSALNVAIGKPAADIVPAIDFFITYFPVIICLLSAVIFFNCFARLLKWLHIPHFNYSGSSDDDTQITGRAQIARERRLRFGARAPSVQDAFNGITHATEDQPVERGPTKWDLRRAELAAGIYIPGGQRRDAPGAASAGSAGSSAASASSYGRSTATGGRAPGGTNGRGSARLGGYSDLNDNHGIEL